MRQRHPVLLEVVTSAGFLGVVAVQGYLVTHLGWTGFLVGLVSGFAWGLMFTFGVPSWLQTDLQVLRGHSRDELFPSLGPAVLPSSRAEVPRDHSSHEGFAQRVQGLGLFVRTAHERTSVSPTVRYLSEGGRSRTPQ